MIHNATIKSAREFDAILSGKVRGQEFVYHEGLLMRDRQTNEHVHAIANRAWDAMDAGAVVLLQRRLEPGVCAYLAIKV